MIPGAHHNPTHLGEDSCIGYTRGRQIYTDMVRDLGDGNPRYPKPDKSSSKR